MGTVKWVLVDRILWLGGNSWEICAEICWRWAHWEREVRCMGS